MARGGAKRGLGSASEGSKQPHAGLMCAIRGSSGVDADSGRSTPPPFGVDECSLTGSQRCLWCTHAR
jgi:hypothetical protein